jgi:hypothetical protein
MTLARIAALVGLSLATPYGAQLPDNPAVCATYAQLEVPAADVPTDADRQRLMGCDSVRLYFGFDKPPRVVDARKCAYLQNQGVIEDNQPFFAATEVLTMIYANGRGAARNYDLALKFACEIGGAPAENSGRVEHLERLKAEGPTAEDFHVCDDFTSSSMEGICAAFHEQFAIIARQRRRDALMAKWRPAEKDAWRGLQKTADEFFAASAANEEDHSGSNRGSWEIGTRVALADGLVKDLEKFEHGTLPRATPDEYRRADARLNARYRQLQAHEFQSAHLTGVDADSIKIAQRAWMRYREAWVEFGKIKYPSVTADSWRTWLTRQRIAMWKGTDM